MHAEFRVCCPTYLLEATTLLSPCECFWLGSFNTSSRAPVSHLLNNHLPAHIFLPIITRETPGLMPKPDPAGILHIAQEWGLDDRADSLIMVRVSYSYISYVQDG